MESRIKELSEYRFGCCLEALEDAEEQVQRAEIFAEWIREYLMNKQIL